MALTVKNILDRVQFTLQDTTNIRWTQTELLNYLNDAQREIALLKPDATSINTNIQLHQKIIQSDEFTKGNYDINFMSKFN